MLIGSTSTSSANYYRESEFRILLLYLCLFLGRVLPQTSLEAEEEAKAEAEAEGEMESDGKERRRSPSPRPMGRGRGGPSASECGTEVFDFGFHVGRISDGWEDGLAD
jgi:hypothetical protein